MLNVRLNSDLEKKLQQYAEVTDRSKTDVVKEALVEYLTKHTVEKSAFGLGEDLFGVATDGDENLSATYKSKLKKKIEQKHTH